MVPKSNVQVSGMYKQLYHDLKQEFQVVTKAYKVSHLISYNICAPSLHGYVILLLERYIRVEKKSCFYTALCASSINNLSLAISATFKHT